MIKSFQKYNEGKVDRYNWFVLDSNGKMVSGWEYLADAFKDGLNDYIYFGSDDAPYDYQDSVDEYLNQFGWGEPGEDLDDYNQYELDGIVKELLDRYDEDDGSTGYRIVKRDEFL